MSFHYNGENDYLTVNRKKIYKFKVNNKNVNFSNQCCLGSMSNVEGEEVPLKGNVHDFSVNYDGIDKSDILNILNIQNIDMLNLVLENNIKQYSGLLNKHLLNC